MFVYSKSNNCEEKDDSDLNIVNIREGEYWKLCKLLLFLVILIWKIKK